MPIIQVILIIIVVGILLWLANTYLPIDEKVKKILNVFVIVVLVLWLLSLFVNLGSLGTIHPHKIG